MRDDEQRGALRPARLAEDAHGVGRVLGIERRGGLVGEHQRGSARERARDGDALLLSDREFLGGRVDALDAERREQRLGARVPLALGGVAHQERDQHVLARAEALQQVEGLEHHAHRAAAEAVARGALERVHVLSRDLDHARGRVDEPCDQLQEGALAAARAAHEEHLLAARERERRHLQLEAAVAVAEVKPRDREGRFVATRGGGGVGALRRACDGRCHGGRTLSDRWSRAEADLPRSALRMRVRWRLPGSAG